MVTGVAEMQSIGPVVCQICDTEVAVGTQTVALTVAGLMQVVAEIVPIQTGVVTLTVCTFFATSLLFT